jgi:hypothetical protein
MTFMSAILQMAEFLESMEPHVRARGWDRMEAQGRDACVRLTGAAAAKEIEAVSLSRYEGQLRSGLKRAVTRAAKLGALAVYFEYDLDNGWDGNFFLCREYVPQAGVEEADEGEDWASDWIEYVAGPAQPKLAAIYAAQRGFSETPEQVGRTAFLVARTVAALEGPARDWIRRDSPSASPFTTGNPSSGSRSWLPEGDRQLGLKLKEQCPDRSSGR